MRFRAVKGTRDVLPAEVAAWQRVEAEARRVFALYGYREIRTPIFEETELFARGIGAETDIVSKEMYTFADRARADRAGLSLTLRPEATAGTMRAVLEHNLAGSDPALRLFTLGPMFRREQPQKGRQRQFHQVNVEALGSPAPTVDAEVIEMGLAYLDACGLSGTELVLNSVGDANCRPAYVERLREALRGQAASMCGDCQRRVETNPLRVLDCKVPEDQARIDALPAIADHLCDACRDHFAEVRRQLGVLGIAYRESHRLVRGLDYYTRTTFEVTHGALGAQNSILGGGRYDGLARELDGGELPAVGFALGLERLVLALGESPEPPRCEVFVADLVPDARDPALRLLRSLRRVGVRALCDPDGRSFKARMKLAHRLGARFVAILGEDELKRGACSVRDMARSEQQEMPATEVAAWIEEKLRG